MPNKEVCMDKDVDSNGLSCFSTQEEWARRHVEEKDDKYRSKFARDRDRILYSKGFRRLSGKTQVFVVGFDDHCRTRLTHTLEVSQIATTICKRLGLNVELTEAIALGHDVGHTPFGHVGERFLNQLMNGCYNVRDLNSSLPYSERGFKHNWQSLRVVTSLEKHDKAHSDAGINLTNFTRWGILNHSEKEFELCKFTLPQKDLIEKDSTKYECRYMHKIRECPIKGKCSIGFYSKLEEDLRESEDWSYEAFIVATADEIAQRHHDIEDGIEANIIDKDRLIDKIETLFKNYFNANDKELINKIKVESEKDFYIPLLSRLVVNLLTSRLIEDSKENLIKLKKDKSINNSCDFKHKKSELYLEEEKKKRINYSDGFKDAESKLKEFLYEIIINSNLAQRMDGKSDFLLRQITKAYVTNPQQLPDSTIITLFKNLNLRLGNYSKGQLFNKLKENNISEEELKERDPGLLRITLSKLHKSRIEEYNYTLLRTICDYIEGMTDQFAINQYEALYSAGAKW
jgi:dGTPase